MTEQFFLIQWQSPVHRNSLLFHVYEEAYRFQLIKTSRYVCLVSQSYSINRTVVWKKLFHDCRVFPRKLSSTCSPECYKKSFYWYKHIWNNKITNSLKAKDVIIGVNWSPCLNMISQHSWIKLFCTGYFPSCNKNLQINILHSHSHFEAKVQIWFEGL